MDRLTGRHRTEWSPRGVIGDLNLVIFDPPGGGPKWGGGGFLINTFLGVIEQLPRTNGVFLGSFLAFFGLFGTPPKNPVF